MSTGNVAAATATPAKLPPLGALRIEIRRGSPVIGWVFVAIGVAAVLYSFYRTVTTDWVWLCLILPFVPVLWIGVWGLRHRIRIFEDGVEVWGLCKRRALRYRDAERLSFQLTDQYVNGVHTGLHAELTLQGSRRKLTFTTRASGNVREQLEWVRDRASVEIARAAWERILRGEAFDWGGTGERIELRSDGLSYRKKRLLGYGDRVVLPYSPALNHAIAQGFFALASDGEVVFSLGCGSDNFYPGLILFESLAGRARRAGRA